MQFLNNKPERDINHREYATNPSKLFDITRIYWAKFRADNKKHKLNSRYICEYLKKKDCLSLKLLLRGTFNAVRGCKRFICQGRRVLEGCGKVLTKCTKEGVLT